MHQYKNNRGSKALKILVTNIPLKVLLKIFYFLGLSVFSERQIISRCQKFIHAKFWIFHLFTVYSIIIGITKYKYNTPYIDNFGKFNDRLKFAIVIITHQITLFETLITRNYEIRFFRLYSKIHGQWSTHHHWKSDLKIYCKLFWRLSLSLLLTLLVEINYSIEVRNETEWLVFFVSYTPSILICRCRILQVIMYVEIIRVELLQLNLELKRLANASKKLRLGFIDDIIYKDLSQCMKRYQDIFEMFELFKKCTPLSPLIIFVATYVKILSDCYWSYWVIYAKFKFQGKKILNCLYYI